VREDLQVKRISADCGRETIEVFRFSEENGWPRELNACGIQDLMATTSGWGSEIQESGRMEGQVTGIYGQCSCGLPAEWDRRSRKQIRDG
jgi:hypothetical protein